ncbi:leukocyte antigen CD37 isoform X4 [Peromyscus eremicus]|uniref:leukocyte antigen CD37 isoform X4 n=1 Tax=Peromyscus eremicus TaxID=42410 RepID=UPI0027DE27CB|nr:leukocyte antigen CD37 isoform X4 [Peromyscus eremicus]
MNTCEGPPIVSLVPTHSKDPQAKMSAQESCLSLIKYFLFVFNLFFFVLGGLIFCFGTWILIDKTSFVSFVGLSFVPLQTWSKVLAVSGVLTMAMALLGCVGALKELRCLLGLYFGMLLLLFATQITLGILISTQRIRLERRVQELVLQTIHSYRTNPEDTAAEESWDYAQFQISRLGPRAKLRQTADLCALPAKAHIYREGCAQSLRKWLHNNLISIVGICLGVGLLEVSGMALCLQLRRRAFSREPVLPLPGAEGSSPIPGQSADGSGGRWGGLSSSSGRSSAPWGTRAMAGACPTWGDKAPQGKLPMALGPWPLWDADEEPPETESSGAEVEVGAQAEMAESPE